MMIRAKGSHKTYLTEGGAVQAVCGVDLEVAEGEIFTLLGPLGCGKTTYCAVSLAFMGSPFW